MIEDLENNRYLNKVVDIIFRDTKIYYGLDSVNITYPMYYDSFNYPYTSIINWEVWLIGWEDREYLRNHYATTEEEENYILQSFMKKLRKKVMDTIEGYYDSTTRRYSGKRGLIESEDRKEKYFKLVSKKMGDPIKSELLHFGIDESEWDKVLSYKFNTEVGVRYGLSTFEVYDKKSGIILYDEYSDNSFWDFAYFDNVSGRLMYHEDIDGVITDNTIDPPYNRPVPMTESVDKTERFIDKIVDFMIKDTVWETDLNMDDTGIGYTVVTIYWPSGEVEEYSLKDFAEEWEKFYMTGYDIQYLNDEFTIYDDDVIQELYNRYIKKLRPIIYEDIKKFNSRY